MSERGMSPASRSPRLVTTTNRGERAIQEEDGPIAENRQLAVGAASSAFGQWAFNPGPEGESTVQ